jgi:hypothetical protein
LKLLVFVSIPVIGSGNPSQFLLQIRVQNGIDNLKERSHDLHASDFDKFMLIDLHFPGTEYVMECKPAEFSLIPHCSYSVNAGWSRSLK